LKRTLSKHLNLKLIEATSGILAPLSFLVGYTLSWALSPWYLLGQHYLSDLGVGEGAIAFNAGVILAGLFTIPFALGVAQSLKEYLLGRFGSVALMGAGLALMAVGLFPESYGRLHMIVSLLFFVLLFLTLFLLVKPMINSKVFCRSGGPLSLALIVSLFLILPFGTGPLTETIVVFEAVIWSLVTATQILLSIGAESSPSSPKEKGAKSITSGKEIRKK